MSSGPYSNERAFAVDYPGLADLNERPLHVDDLPAGMHWACSPPPDGTGLPAIHFDWRCPTCVDSAADFVRRGFDPFQAWRLLVTDEPKLVKLSWLVSRSRYWLPRMTGPCPHSPAPCTTLGFELAGDGEGRCDGCLFSDGLRMRSTAESVG